MPIVRIAGALHHYVHVPKCGGKSVESYLIARFGSLAFLNDRFYKTPSAARWTKSSPQHVEAAAFQSLFPEDWIASQFAVVRNPLTRFASSYNYYLANLKRTPRLMGPEEWFAEYLGFAEKAPHYLDNHLRPQSEMIPTDCQIFQIEKGMDAVVAHLDVLAGNTDGPREIEHGHVTQDLNGMEKVPLPDPLVKRLRRYYAADFERFGYDPAAQVRVAVYSPHISSISPQMRFRLHRKRLQRRLWSTGLRFSGRVPD